MKKRISNIKFAHRIRRDLLRRCCVIFSRTITADNSTAGPRLFDGNEGLVNNV